MPFCSGVNRISVKIETHKVTRVKICLIKYKDQKEIFFLPPEVAAAVLIGPIRSRKNLRKMYKILTNDTWKMNPIHDFVCQ